MIDVRARNMLTLNTVQSLAIAAGIINRRLEETRIGLGRIRPVIVFGVFGLGL